MVLIVTPLGKWRREIRVYHPYGEGQAFAMFQRANEGLEKLGIRNRYNVTLVPISVAQVSAWLTENLEPTWWERTTGRIRWVLVRRVAS